MRAKAPDKATKRLLVGILLVALLLFFLREFARSVRHDTARSVVEAVREFDALRRSR